MSKQKQKFIGRITVSETTHGFGHLIITFQEVDKFVVGEGNIGYGSSIIDWSFPFQPIEPPVFTAQASGGDLYAGRLGVTSSEFAAIPLSELEHTIKVLRKLKRAESKVFNYLDDDNIVERIKLYAKTLKIVGGTFDVGNEKYAFQTIEEFNELVESAIDYAKGGMI